MASPSSVVKHPEGSGYSTLPHWTQAQGTLASSLQFIPMDLVELAQVQASF